ncbi:hypothetical protein JCM9534A_00860 [Catenuloplanes indicus JCM 9534]
MEVGGRRRGGQIKRDDLDRHGTAELVRERGQWPGAAGDEDEVRTTGGQGTGERGADAGAGPGDQNGLDRGAPGQRIREADPASRRRTVRRNARKSSAGDVEIVPVAPSPG